MSIMKYVMAFLLVAGVAAQAQDEDFYHPELDWRTIETTHFFVHYHNGTERTAKVVAKVAEDIYGPVTSLYHHEPDSKVNFVIKDYDDYSNGAAYFFDNKIEIWASALDFDLRGTHNWLRNVVTHEFTHIVEIQTSLKFGRKVPAIYLQWLQYESERRTDVLYGYPNGLVSYPISGFVVPSWFAEGVAQYNRKELGYDSWDAHRDMILRMYSLDGNMLTWNAMSVFGKTSLGNESSYNAGFAFVRYIGERYGDTALAAISRNLSSLPALTIDGAIGRAVGKSGGELYDEWKEHLRSDYAERVAGVRTNLVEGSIVGNEGFGNFYPHFSPDGKSIAYVSNKDADYFALSSLYLYDIASRTEKLLAPGVHSNFSWSPDGRKLYYAKFSRSNDHWSGLFDVYEYDVESKEARRLTHGLRANAPAVSPDGKTIVFVAGGDGTINLWTMNADGTNPARLTDYSNGEQVYNPSWSPDGKTILFDYSIKDGRDLAEIPAGGGEVRFLLATPDDERNGAFTPDGSAVIYSSDKSGVFNLYSLNLRTNDASQLTNVLGGAFMPAVNASGKVAFASYTSSGYKLALIDSVRPLDHVQAYMRPTSVPSGMIASASDGNGDQAFDWPALRSYDDTQVPSYDDRSYTTHATSLSLLPLLRVDNYNPRNKGIDVVKLGLYAYSFDVLDRFGFFAGAAVNRQGERDLFFNFDYRGKIPGLYQLGFEPALSLEAYNLTRNTDNVLTLRQDLVIPVEITYNLLEFDAALKQKLFTEALGAELRYQHSRYTASVGSFLVHDTLSGGPVILQQSFGSTYLKGNDLSFSLVFEAMARSTTQEINPVGRRLRLKYDYSFNEFNPRDTIVNGELIHVYENPDFHRLELSWTEHHRLPGWSHTLSGQVRGGTTFGPPVDDFFDFYIGGLAGMRGYPFYSLGGNEYALANLTYRFPLLEHIDLRVLQISFDKLYASVYGDAGATWTSGGISGQRFRRDAGAELRIQAFSYYAFPTSIFFSATYGFDQFQRYVSPTATTVTYGKEWNYHFGVLFGFDIGETERMFR